MNKRTITTILLLLCLTLAACAPARNDTRTFGAVDVDPEDVAQRMVTAIGGQGTYMEADDDLYDFYFGESEAYPLLDDACMIFAREETDVSEFGVFAAERKEDAQAVRDMVQAYLDDRTATLRSFAANYSPQDLAKIDNAGISIYGRYVVYYILDDVDQTAALDAAESVLRKE